jgi:ribosomal protein L29
MDLTKKIPVGELRGYEKGRVNETEKAIRKELLNIRMEIFKAAAVNSGKKRQLKKTLARLLTVKAEKQGKLQLGSKK